MVERSVLSFGFCAQFANIFPFIIWHLLCNTRPFHYIPSPQICNYFVLKIDFCVKLNEKNKYLTSQYVFRECSFHR